MARAPAALPGSGSPPLAGASVGAIPGARRHGIARGSAERGGLLALPPGCCTAPRGVIRRGLAYHPVMKTSGITAALPAQDLGRAKAFYVEKVGLQALESGFLQARDGRVGLAVGNGLSQLFVYPARIRSSGEFTQAVIHVTDVRAAVDEMRGRGVAFEEYDTPETRTENGVARMPGGGEAAWFKDSEGNLVGLVPA
jgi:predicted enzyme related to lactoylglutathione lyase